MHLRRAASTPQRVAVHPGIYSSCISEGGLALSLRLRFPRVPVRGGFLRALPPLLCSPRPRLGTRPARPRWLSRKRRRAAGRWLRSGRSSCGTRGRTSSWAALGPAGVRGVWGRQAVGRRLAGAGSRQRGPSSPAGSLASAPLPGSELGGGRITGLIFPAGRCGGGESRSLLLSRPLRSPLGRGVASSARVSAPRSSSSEPVTVHRQPPPPKSAPSLPLALSS